MPRFEMINREDLSAMAEFMRIMQYLSDEIVEGGELEAMWGCLESLNEMGVVSKDVLTTVGALVHDLADEGQIIIDYIDATEFGE